jgi:hypothetical protein
MVCQGQGGVLFGRGLEGLDQRHIGVGCSTEEHAPFDVSLDVLRLSLTDAPPHNVFVLCDNIFPILSVLEECLGGSIDGRGNNGEFGRHGPQPPFLRPG